MSENEYRGQRHHHFYFGWAVLAFLGLIATIGTLSWVFFRSVPGTGPYYFFPFGGLFAIFWIIGIFWIVRWFFWGGRWGYHYPRHYLRHYDDAYYILRERYARGEITKDQYDQMMRDLQTPNQ